MKLLVALSALAALSAAQYQPFGYPYAGYYGSYAPYYGATPYTTYSAAPYTAYAAAPYTTSSQFHAQDELGGYSYGYQGGPSAKTEHKNAFGATVGSYSYIDANGETQTVSYTADPVNGFQVEATNLPVAPVADLKAPEAPVADLKAPVFNLKGPEPVQDTPEVAQAKAEFAEKYAAAAAAAAAAPDTDVEEEAEEPAAETAERRRRSAVLIPAVREATFKTASLDKVEADTPADTTLLELKETEHKTLVPAPAIAYAAPVAYHAAPIAPIVKQVEVKTVPAPITYATHAAVHYSAPAITYTVPEVKVKEVEVKHVASPITYAAHPFAYGAYPYGYGTPLIYNIAPKAAEAEEEEAPEEPAVETAERKRRSAVLIPAVREATFKTASLDKVEADTPADTTLLKLKETEHKTLVPAPAIAYAAPAFTYSAAAPLPLAYRPYSFGYGSPLIYNIAPKAAEAEEKAE